MADLKTTMKPNLDSTFTRRDFVRSAAVLGLAALSRNSLAEAGPAAGSPWQIGCYTRPWDQYEYRVALDSMAEAGFKYAGLMTAKGSKSSVIINAQLALEEAARIGEEVKQRGLKTLSVYGDFSAVESPERGLEQLRRFIDLCAACGSPNLLLSGNSQEKQYEAYYRVIGECCDYAASKAVAMSIKPHGGQISTGPQCRQAIESVKHRSFGLWYDPGNIFYYSNGERDPVDDAATVDGLVIGMSVKDYRHPKEVLVTPGTGKVNFAAVFARLQKGGFVRSPLIVECLARGDAAFVTAEAKKARQFLQELTAK